MDRERIDLSPLDPARDERGREGLVAGIMAEAAPELARRSARRRSVAAALAGWARPALAAALLLLAISAAVLGTAEPLEAPDAPTVAGILEAPELPEPLTALLREEQPPSVAELIIAMEEDVR